MGSQDNTSSHRVATHWDLDEEKDLIAFLSTCKSEAGDTMSFKAHIFTEAAKYLNTTYPTPKGTPKSQSSCKTKWTALKRNYTIVKDIKLSGFAWNDEHGVSVTPETSGTWDTYSQAHPQSKPYSSKRFPHFYAIEEMMPSVV
ncbi:hypothetical protein BDR07DRAFT_1280085 [Suillus spraguei]|nr:hypothetical protein BDR07DRAFT_1280085 [Suillus spraguei]